MEDEDDDQHGDVELPPSLDGAQLPGLRSNLVERNQLVQELGERDRLGLGHGASVGLVGVVTPSSRSPWPFVDPGWWSSSPSAVAIRRAKRTRMPSHGEGVTVSVTDTALRAHLR